MIKLYLRVCCLILALLPMLGYGQKDFKRSIEGDYERNKLMVKYKTLANASTSAKSGTIKAQGVTIIQQEPFLKSTLSQKSGLQTQQKIDPHGLGRIFKVTYSAKKNINLVIDELMETGEFEYVEPAYIFHMGAIPNDPRYSNQWALPKVFAPEAWDIRANADGQIIAIIDSGSELNHPDLAANIFLNTADPVDGFDNDGDGYVDNYFGWDFIGSTEGAGGDNDPNVVSAANDHGVHVSGIASAVTNNGVGVASIAQSAKLLILKVAADDNKDDIFTTAAFDALRYAMHKGAKIINCSWGRNGSPSKFEQDVINDAIAQGCLIIAAAGNSGTDIPEYPAAYDGVLAVANLDADDIKSGTSSYGYHIAISAPGTSILSTTYGQSYSYKTGTSMATPMVASAAALVAAQYPALNGEQIGEILRSSADDIYSLNGNANYINQLGSGRLNVLKALQAGNSPGIRKQNIQVSDPSGSFNNGDTIALSFLLKNLLQPATNLQVTLGSDNNRVQILDPQADMGSFNTSEQKWTPGMKVYIEEDIPENEEVVFYLSYASTAEAYQAKEYFSLKLNRDFINYQLGDIETTITSNGRIGYPDAEAADGNGWKYKGENLLFEASLMIAAQGNRLVSNSRTEDGDAADDFKKLHSAAIETDSLATFKAVSVFDDSRSSQPLNLQITHRHYGFADDESLPYVIVEYDMRNLNSSALSDVYAGIFSDWDVSDGTKNNTRYLTDLRMSYTWSAENSTGPYTGVKLLNNDSQSHYYPMSYNISGDPLADDNFSKEEKIRSLSSGIDASGLSGVDVMCVTASGPYAIAAGASKKVAFALVSGDNLDELREAAQLAQGAYDKILSKTDDLTSFKLLTVYPNPVHVEGRFATLEIVLPTYGHLRVELLNAIGGRVSTVIDQNFVAGLHKINLPVNDLQAGVYYGVVYFNGERKGIKLLVME